MKGLIRIVGWHRSVQVFVSPLSVTAVPEPPFLHVVLTAIFTRRFDCLNVEKCPYKL